MGSGLLWVNQIRIWILKTGSVDPDPTKMDRIRNTAILVNLCFKNSYDSYDPDPDPGDPKRLDPTGSGSATLL